MEQYKVILVDDEVEVIDVMKKKIRWNDLGFDVVGSATNGVKALELVEKLQPDVVLTDIKMPYMDGLELARKLNQDAYSARTAHPFQRNGAPFRFKLSKAQQVD